MKSLRAGVACTSPPLSSQVTTSQQNNARMGATLNEENSRPAKRNSRTFGKLGAFKVDGAVYAQPLFLPGVDIPGKGIHNVLRRHQCSITFA